MTTTVILSLVIVLLIAVIVFLLLNFMKSRNKNLGYEKKYGGIISIDEEIQKNQEKFSKEKKALNDQISDLKSRLGKMKVKYAKATEAYDKLVHDSNLLKDDLEIAEFGIYETHYDFDTSERFKDEIKKIKERQKILIKEKRAIVGGDGWTVNGNVQKGKVMINRQKKLMLRAFNGECNGFISSVRWNNITKMEERIGKSFIAVNKMGESQKVEITSKYQELKREELRLTHEYKLKKYEEKEQQREIRAQLREEEKARRDFEKAQKEAEKDARLLQQAMKKAQAEITKSTAEERAKLEKELESLKSKLQEAQEKNQRAISMAQQTRSGHVYVISNLGAFGENVYKIGMTRRLEPLDRVHELGDASVPFRFDVHAMIYSDDAPTLENTLHKTFEKRRMNYVNRRREYFQISLEEIEKVVLENHGEIEFIHEPEAREFRESQVIREQMIQGEKELVPEPSYPSLSSLFDDE